MNEDERVKFERIDAAKIAAIIDSYLEVDRSRIGPNGAGVIRMLERYGFVIVPKTHNP